MPMKCERCGHIHWDEKPVLRDTYQYLQEHGTARTRDVADRFDTTVQNANNRLSRLEDLGVCSSRRVPQQTGGYVLEYVLRSDTDS